MFRYLMHLVLMQGIYFYYDVQRKYSDNLDALKGRCRGVPIGLLNEDLLDPAFLLVQRYLEKNGNRSDFVQSTATNGQYTYRRHTNIHLHNAR